METVCVFQANDHFTALAAKELLESNDIVCLMPNEHLSGVVPYYSMAIGGYSLFVQEADFKRSRELLKFINNKAGITNTRIEPEQKSEGPGESCPKCGGSDIEIEIKNRRSLIVSLYLLFTVPVPAKKAVKRCNACNHHWK